MNEELNITKENTKKRLIDINAEIDELKLKSEALKEHWTLEKNYISAIRRNKSLIEQAKKSAADAERNGDLAKVAEIRYGTILQLENEIKIINAKLTALQSNGKMLKEEVQAEDIAEIVAKWTGIPITKMLETEISKLLQIEDRLHKRLIGQEEAVSSIANAIRRSRAGLQDPNKPIGSFIFLGTTGVGKTEMAKALAEFLFNDENSIIRIDMSEYMEKHAVSRLIGAPPGYIGYEEGGQLTESVRRKPYSVILLDEIEKAHSDVFNVLLQVLDDGRLTDGKGRTVNFKNTIIIMTSNLGTDIIQAQMMNSENGNALNRTESLKFEMMNLLKKTMRPEFLNRIDEIIIFKPLTAQEINQITDLQLSKVKDKLNALRIGFEISENAKNRLSKIGYDPQFGARPLKRVIQKNIIDKLAVLLLSSEFSAGETVSVELDDKNHFIFNKK